MFRSWLRALFVVGCIRAVFLNRLTLSRTTSAGMAKPSPCVGTPCGVNAIFAEAIPTSRPEMIDHRPTAVTRIDRRIGLHEIFVFGVVDGDVAFHRAKNASADRTAVADSVAYHNHCLAKQVRRNVVEVDERKCDFARRS